MNLFTHHSDRNETEFIIDIETSTVRALLVRYRHGVAPVVFARSSRTFRLLPQADFYQVWREIRNAVTAVLDDLVSESGVRPGRAQCILAAPWYAAQIRTVNISRKTPFRISHKLIFKVRNEEEQQFRQHVREMFIDFEHNVRIIERQLVHMRLNGYAVNHFEDKDATQAELTFYHSVLDDAMHSLMEEMLQDYVIPEHIQFHTFPFVAFQALKHLLNTEEGFLFIRIGGEATELFSVAGDTVQDIASFMIGEHEVVRETAHALHTTTESAASQLRQYQIHQLREDAAAPIKTAIDHVSREWFGRLKNFLSVASRRRPVSQTIFFSADSPLTEAVRVFLQQDYAKYFTLFGKPFDVKIFSPRVMRQFVVSSQDFYPGDEILLFGALASSYPYTYVDFSTIVA